MAYPLTWPPTVEQVQTVVANTTDPDTDVAAAARAELQYMVETTLGVPLEQAFPSEWASVKSTGAPETVETEVDTTSTSVAVTFEIVRESHTVTSSTTPDTSPIIPGPLTIQINTDLSKVSWDEPFFLDGGENIEDFETWGSLTITLDPVRIQRITSFAGWNGQRWRQSTSGLNSFPYSTDALSTPNYFMVFQGTSSHTIWTKRHEFAAGWNAYSLGFNNTGGSNEWPAFLCAKIRTTSTMDQDTEFVEGTTSNMWMQSFDFAYPRFVDGDSWDFGGGGYEDAFANMPSFFGADEFPMPSGDGNSGVVTWDSSVPQWYVYLPVGSTAADKRVGYSLAFCDTQPWYHDLPIHSGPGSPSPAAYACRVTSFAGAPPHSERDMGGPQIAQRGTILESGYVDWSPVTTGGIAYFAVVGEAETSEPSDGAPPTVIPNPPLITPKPISGGCKATMDLPSSCNFNIPVDPDPDSPDFPDPGDLVDPDIPDFDVPEMPVIDVDVPTFPPIDCLLPDFGNLSDCEPGPGSGAGLPGGRDRHGRRGAGMGGIKTGGPTYNNRDWNFRDNYPDGAIDPDTGEPIIPPQRSWPEGSSVMTTITVILLDLGISPLNIIFEVGPEWDKTFGPKTFSTTMRMFDAAQWLASLIMCRIIDEGDGKVYIGPITHRPGQNTWTFNSQFPNADGDPPMLGLGYGASMGEAYYAVEVWGAHLGESVFALVDIPFSVDPQNILSIEVGPDYSLAEAQDLAAFRAGLIRREAVMVQVEVPYSQEYFMRDKVILKFPDRGFQSNYILFGKQSEFSIEKRVHILSCVLPATLEELENFPEVMGEGMDAIEMGFA